MKCIRVCMDGLAIADSGAECVQRAVFEEVVIFVVARVRVLTVLTQNHALGLDKA